MASPSGCRHLPLREQRGGVEGRCVYCLSNDLITSEEPFLTQILRVVPVSAARTGRAETPPSGADSPVTAVIV